MLSFFNRRSRAQQQNIRVMTADLPLEKRLLLAGNALVNVSGGNVSISGDADNNAIELTTIGGNVVVRGLQGTTINGNAGSLIVAENTDTLNGRLVVRLGEGNDSFLLSRSVIVNGSAVIDAGNGNDDIGSTGSTIRGSLEVHGRQGDNQISFSDSTVDGRLWIKTKRGSDIVSLKNVTVNGRLKIKTGAGEDGVSLDNVTVSDKTSIHTKNGADDVLIQNSTFNAHVKIRTRQNDDNVVLEGNTFRSTIHINTGRNIDNVVARGTNTFDGAFSVNSGDGHTNGSVGDAVEIASTNVFNSSRSIRKAEGATAPPTVISTRIDDTTNGLVGLAAAADKAISDLLVTSVSDLTLDLSANTTVASTGDVLITRDENFVIAGTTTALSTVTLDTDGNGQFDNGTVTADENGNFSTTVTLTRRDLNTTDTVENDQMSGFQQINIQSLDEAGGLQTATVKVDFVKNTVVQFVSNIGTYEVEMFDDLTPNTVANFLGYTDRYDGVIIHRSVTDFVIQGGGFTVNNGVVDAVQTDAPITNEFNSSASNIRGTLSMAQLGGDINSGTSQWFVNTVNNDGSGVNNLDSVPHTVFGRVIGEGMSVVDSIAALSKADLSSVTGVSALNETPLQSTFTPLTRTITGTVSTTGGSTVVTGVGTRFTEELVSALGNTGGSRSRISIDGTIYNVASISSDTELTLSSSAITSSTNVNALTDDLVDDAFVRFSSIAEILNQV
ncbi:MAG: peptidylprolyl isomerase [Planctomycetaceae bacterium]|nr:peptidylprolyl isomerase [Planctomycetaceae bacterium]